MIAARDGDRDRINCGTGFDKVTADRIDLVSSNCESVKRFPSPADDNGNDGPELNDDNGIDTNDAPDDNGVHGPNHP